MNSSEGVTALVPPVVVTVTSTVPVPAGTVAVMSESLFTVKFGDGEDRISRARAGEAGPADVNLIPARG